MAEEGSGMQANVANALCYAPIIGWIVSIVMLIVDKRPGVRWNAVQSLVITGVFFVVSLVMGVTVVLALLSPILWLGEIVLSIILAVKAYQGQTVRLPVVADWADKLMKKV